MKGNICQNETNLLPSMSIDEKQTNVNENFTKTTKNVSPKKLLNDITKEKKRLYNIGWNRRNKEKRHNYYIKHKDHIKKYISNYRIENKDKIKKWNKQYNFDNKEKTNKYATEKWKTDINYKISKNLRSRLRLLIKNNQKAGSAVNDLVCTIPELKQYIESKFQEGMTWNNWSKHGWHIDHIKPLSSFDLTDREQFLKANHYTNLQPLWANDNWCKAAYFTKSQDIF